MNDLITEEILQEIMGEMKPKTTSRYVSCIRIAGSPILPPLIDDRYRGELIHYRNMAILVEKKIKDRKKLKDNRQSVDSGVMISASASEPSCFRPCMIQTDKNEDFMTQYCDGSENKRNCDPQRMVKSDSSDAASPQNFISDDDMWRYLSNCAEGDFSTTTYDDQGKDFASCLRTTLMTDSDRSTTVHEKQIVPNCVLHSVSNRNESQLNVDNVPSELGNLPFEDSDLTVRHIISNTPCEKDIVEQDNTIPEKNVNSTVVSNKINHSEVNKSHSCSNINLKNKDTCILPHKLNSEHNYLNRCVGGETYKNCLVDSMLPITGTGHNGEIEIPVYDFSIANLDAITGRTSNVDCSFQFQESKEISKENMFSLTRNTNSLRKDPSSVFETSLCETNVLQGGDGDNNSDKFSSNDKETHASPVQQICEKVLSNIKISCSSVMLPEYPDMLPARDLDKQKTVKEYNPMCYGDCESKTETEENDQDFVNCSGTSIKTRRQWMSDHIENSSSEEYGEEHSKSNMDDLSTNLDNSSASQKQIADVQLSESVSISEIDFNSSSVGTIPPDILEENGDIQSHLHTDRENELMPPKLVRQNSYTLIAPSPILLAHAKAIEKPEEKMSSENASIRVQDKNNRKTWDHSKTNTDYEAEKEIKYSPYKSHQEVDFKSTSTMKGKGKSNQQSKVLSLPGTTVSSPVKVNPYHSSLDNLPIVTVRKFQEFINRQYNKKQLVHEASNANFTGKQEILSNKSALCNRSSSLDLQKFDQKAVQSRPRSRSKSDLQEAKFKNSVLSNVDSIESRSTYNTDIEMMHRSTSCSPVVSNTLLQSKGRNLSTPKSNQSNQTDFDEFSPGFSTSPSDTDKKTYQDSVGRNEKVPLSNSLSPSDITVQHIFLQLQNQHSQLMAQLLDRQKKEQEALAHTFLNQQRQILQEMKLIPSSPGDMQLPSANSDTSSCSIEKSSPSAQENKVSDLVSEGSHISNTVEMAQPSGNSDHSRYSDSTGTISVMQHQCNDELRITPPPTPPRASPPQRKALPRVTEEQKNAATVINAAARGYLTRRLLKTDYVQEIINTISESVQCALQLQKECPVDITPSDVELHRRLIQQLTAACYSLHDTFFSLSSQEKMSIIANDRERRRTLVPRPASARSSLSAATQKYIQRKQQQNSHQSDRPSSNTRRSWWRSKGRACSAGEAPRWLPQQYPSWQYEQSTSYYSKQPMVVTSKQQQCNNRANRRPWR